MDGDSTGAGSERTAAVEDILRLLAPITKDFCLVLEKPADDVRARKQAELELAKEEKKRRKRGEQ